jgi:hypothetical protein
LSVFTASTWAGLTHPLPRSWSLDEDRYVIISYVNYRKEPEYIWDIGNTITENPEQDIVERFVFAGTALRQVKKNFYLGIPFDV